MPFSITCPSCFAKLKSNAAIAKGRSIQCPKCKESFAVSAENMVEIPAGKPAPTPAKAAPPARKPVEDSKPFNFTEGRSSKDRGDDEDDRPRAKRRTVDDEDDDRPRSKRRQEDDEDEDDRPRSRKPMPLHDDDEDERPRRKRRDDEEDDDRPRPKKRGRRISDKSKTTALLLWLVSFHRIYVGKIGSNILYWITCGGVGVWSVMDLISILGGKFEDKNGRPLEE